MPNNDGDMDENELAIAQILAEEAKALDNNANGANANNFNSNNYNDFNGSSMAGSNNNPIPNDGVRAPDEARFAVLSGPDPYDDDYDPEFERQVQREQRRME